MGYSLLSGGLFRSASLAALCFYAAPGAAQTSYDWTGAVSTDIQTPGNWNPARNVPAANDILNFKSGGNVAVTLLASPAVGELHVTDATTVTLSAPSAVQTLFVQGTVSPTDFEVAAGSALVWSGAMAVTVNLVATGEVHGDIVFTSTGSGVPHRLTATNIGGAEGLVFHSGSSFQFAPGGSSAGSPFGTTAANSVRFKNGSRFYQGGTASGPSASPGSHPFGLSAPASVVVFEPDSAYHQWWNNVSMAGRTFGNVILDHRNGELLVGPVAAWSANDLTVRASAQSTRLAGTANPVLTVNGDFTVEPGAVFGDSDGASLVSESGVLLSGNVDADSAGLNFTTNARRPWKLVGASVQNIKLPAGKTLPALTLNNAAGARLLGDAVVGGPLTLNAGALDTNGFTLTAAADGPAGVVRAGGYVLGALTRIVNAANTGSRLFPVGTDGEYAGVQMTITSAGTGTGAVSVSSTAADHPDVADPAGTLDRTWSVSAPGIDLSAGAAQLAFTYAPGDVTGTVIEANMVAGRRAGASWQHFPTAVDTGTRTAVVAGVTAFSDWTLGNSAAVPVALSAFAVD